MTAEEFLRAAERLPLVSLDRLIPEGGAVILAPHPDDESLGCGGLIALMSAAGRSAQVVVMSDGTGSHPRSRSHPRPLLRALRQAEACEALAVLGAPPPKFLDWPDGNVPVSGAAFEAAVDQVMDAARDHGTLFATIALDPHKDHAATWAIAREAARRGGQRLLGYAVWSWRYLYPEIAPIDPATVTEPPRGMRLDVAAASAVKRRAVMAHRSQTTRLIADDPDGFMLNDAVLNVLLRPFELYLEDLA